MLLTVSAATWPIMKIGSEHFTPLWFTALRLSVAGFALFIVLASMRAVSLPRKGDLKVIVVVGGFQMALFLVFAHLGIEHIHASQASVLCYATPLFVVPLSFLCFGESPSKIGWVGVALCLAGVAVLFSPWNYDWHHRAAWAASGLLLLSAACWSVAILYLRHGSWQSPMLMLQLWQVCFATVICLAMALRYEGLPNLALPGKAWGALLFTGAVSGAFGQWAMNNVQRRVHPVTVSAAYLIIPAATLVLCFFILGEQLTGAKIAAVVLIVAGSVLCMTKGTKRTST
jgi:drug/metabolite transporter (DMT)-like permease